jgi:outer membrane cobalamin receptor
MHKVIHIAIHTVYIFILAFCLQGYLFAFQSIGSDFPFTQSSNVDTLQRLSTLFKTRLSGKENSRGTSGAIEIATTQDPAPSDEESDSSKLPTIKLDGVTVTATRVPQSSIYSPHSVTVVPTEAIESMNATTLADVIASTPGVFIKDYGAPSGIKTISQRGLATEHTLVLLDGVRISSTQNGGQDLGLISVDEIGSVEILRGGQSATFGADAVAGIVNIVSRPIEAGIGTSVLGSFGSFGYRRYHVSANAGNGSDGLQFGFGEERSTGDFPFAFRNGAQRFDLLRKNADLKSRFASVNGKLIARENTQIMLRGSTYSSDRGVGGVVVSPFSTSIARQADRDNVLLLTVATSAGADDLLRVKAQYHSAYERYQDPRMIIGGIPLDNYFRNVDVRLEPQWEIPTSDVLTLALGSEWVRTIAEGNSLRNATHRDQAAGYVAAEYSPVNGNDQISRLTLFPAIRLDAVSTMSPTWSPQLGCLMRLKDFSMGSLHGVGIALRGSVSRNFRMPTFNELYFNGGGGIGNATLKSERSTSIDGGGTLQFSLFGDHTIAGTWFLNDMNNRVVWTAAGGGVVTPKNLRHVRSEGIEAAYGWESPENTVSLSLSYSSSDSRKVSEDYAGDPTANTQLVFVPEETFSTSLGYLLRWDDILIRETGIRLSHTFTGFRYFTEDNTAFLPGYAISDFSVRTKFRSGRTSVVVKGEVNNLFDKEYQVMLGYPMPGRSFRLTVGVEYR